MLHWIVWNRTICMNTDLALNNLQRMICHKTQTSNQLLRTHNMQMTLRFLQIHLPKPSSYCMALASTCFNKKGNISTLNDGSLKSQGKFMYFQSSDSSTENDIHTRLAKSQYSQYQLLSQYSPTPPRLPLCLYGWIQGQR